MKARRFICVSVAVLVAWLAITGSASAADRSIVRTKTGLDGWSVIRSVCALYGCQVVRALDVLPGQTQGASLFLVLNLDVLSVNLTLSLLGVTAIEPDLPVAVTQTSPYAFDQATAAVVDRLRDRTPVTYYGTSGWESYVQQPASDIVRVREAHCDLHATGGPIVAVIDTGVDPDHPTLRDLLIDGYDFTRDTGGGGEMADLGQATAAVVDDVWWVNQATAAVVDQATAAVVDDPTRVAFGHGTMVSGVVHLVAPTARIMPLKVFGANGLGYTSDVLRALYYATKKGAKVLNMSFSRPTSSAELKRAVDYATGRGVIAVASAGNGGIATKVYPAAYGNVMGVASTTNDDLRSSFSNYGSTLVWVAAPGEGIITTYPWGSFAAAWGTSFSTPFVSGTAALLAGIQGTATHSQVAWAISHAKPLTAELGYGRLDIVQAVEAGWSLWPSGVQSPVPESCAAAGIDWSVVP
jgi:subtilisin family serine protease